MATLSTSIPVLQVTNVPMLNVRSEFNITLGLFRNGLFRKHFRESDQRIALRLPFGSWRGRRNLLLTQILRETTVGLESSVSSAVFALAARGESRSHLELEVDRR